MENEIRRRESFHPKSKKKNEAVRPLNPWPDVDAFPTLVSIFILTCYPAPSLIHSFTHIPSQVIPPSTGDEGRENLLKARTKFNFF